MLLRISAFVVFSFLSQFAFAQSLYDLGTIQQIKVYFPFDDWDTRLDTAKNGSDGYLLCDSVVVNGQLFKGCGVKYKGNSSYSPNGNKNPLHIQLEFTEDGTYQGYDEIKLGNGWSDNSMIREPLAYYILRHFMEAPRSNFAQVYINDAYYGIMTNTEDLGKAFLADHFHTSKHTFVKCNPSFDMGTEFPGLEYLGSNLTEYESTYEMRSDTGWNDLIGLCDTLNNHFNDFATIADVDRFLWMLAFNNVIVNLDSYSGIFKQNYYLYRNHQGYWIPTIWDLNMSFGGFGVAGGNVGFLTPTAMRTMSHTLHRTDLEWPLINKLLNNATYQKMYFAHMRSINQAFFANEAYKTMADSLHNLITTAVQTDNNYLTTFTNFQNSLNNNTTGQFGDSPGIYPLMDNRSNFLDNVLSAAPPGITNVQQFNATSDYGTTAQMIASVSNATKVFLGFRYNKSDQFVRVEMFDDGQHNDMMVGDGVYGADMPILSLRVDYYIYAENANAGMFSPERAEFEFHTLKATFKLAEVNDPLTLSEIAANNQSNSIENEKGKMRDWIEIRNASNSALQLGHLYLSDSYSNLTKWQFPDRAFIKPDEHLLIWADDLDKLMVDLHTNFNLSSLGDTIILSDGNMIWEEYYFGPQEPDKALANCDGAFESTQIRTPRNINQCVDATFAPAIIGRLDLVPNPATEYVRIEHDQPVDRIAFFANDGRQVLSATGTNTLDISGLRAGIYHLKILDNRGQWYFARLVVN